MSTENIFKVTKDTLVTRVLTKKSMLYKSYLFSNKKMDYCPSDFKVNPLNGLAYLPNEEWGEIISTVDVDKLPDPHDAWVTKHNPEPDWEVQHPKDNI